jgi:hypothetical protein
MPFAAQASIGSVRTRFPALPRRIKSTRALAAPSRHSGRFQGLEALPPTRRPGRLGDLPDPLCAEPRAQAASSGLSPSSKLACSLFPVRLQERRTRLAKACLESWTDRSGGLLLLRRCRHRVHQPAWVPRQGNARAGRIGIGCKTTSLPAFFMPSRRADTHLSRQLNMGQTSPGCAMVPHRATVESR